MKKSKTNPFVAMFNVSVMFLAVALLGCSGNPEMKKVEDILKNKPQDFFPALASAIDRDDRALITAFFTHPEAAQDLIHTPCEWQRDAVRNNNYALVEWLMIKNHCRNGNREFIPVRIEQGKLFFDGKHVLDLVNNEIPLSYKLGQESYVVKPLLDMAKRTYAKIMEIASDFNHAAWANVEIAMLFVDPDISDRTKTEIYYTLGQAGFRQYKTGSFSPEGKFYFLLPPCPEELEEGDRDKIMVPKSNIPDNMRNKVHSIGLLKLIGSSGCEKKEKKEQPEPTREPTPIHPKK